MDPQTDAGAAPHRETAPQIQSAATPQGPRSRANVSPAPDIAAWQLQAWLATARHLNAAGYAAAVPACLVGQLRRRGLEVWAARRDAA
jgi:hypothetical protein